MPVLEQQRVGACERSVIILVLTRTRARETRSPDSLPRARRWSAQAPAWPWRYRRDDAPCAKKSSTLPRLANATPAAAHWLMSLASAMSPSVLQMTCGVCCACRVTRWMVCGGNGGRGSAYVRRPDGREELVHWCTGCVDTSQPGTASYRLRIPQAHNSGS